MNRVSLLALLGACAMSLGVGSGALADNSKDAHEPTAQELKESKERGIFLKVPGSPAAFELQKATPTAPTAAATTTSKTTKTTVKSAEPAKVSGSGLIPVKTTVKTTVKETAVKESSKEAAPTKAAPAKSTKPQTTSSNAAKGKLKTAIKATPKSVKTAAKLDINSSSKASANAGAAASAVATSDQGETVIQAWLNKGGKRPCYKDGDKLAVNVKASKDCNLVIYDFDGRGTLTQIFPNEFQKECSVKAGETVTIGGDNSKFDFEVSLAEGTKNQQERLFIFAYPSKDEAPVSVAMAKVPDSPFRSANISMEEYRKLVNQSKVYFARTVSVKAKKNTISSIQTVSNEINNGEVAPNKMELSFSVEK